MSDYASAASHRDDPHHLFDESKPHLHLCEAVMRVTSYAYDALSRKTHTFEGDADPAGTRYTYDGLSRLRQVEQWSDPWTGTGPYTEKC